MHQETRKQTENVIILAINMALSRSDHTGDLGPVYHKYQRLAALWCSHCLILIGHCDLSYVTDHSAVSKGDKKGWEEELFLDHILWDG